jgi:hypothetical protein
MQKKELQRRVNSSVQAVNPNIIAPLTLNYLLQFNPIILSKLSSLRLKKISRFSAKTTQIFMLFVIAVTIEPFFALIALTKNTPIISTPVNNLTKRVFKISSNKILAK